MNSFDLKSRKSFVHGQFVKFLNQVKLFPSCNNCFLSRNRSLLSKTSIKIQQRSLSAIPWLSEFETRDITLNYCCKMPNIHNGQTSFEHFMGGQHCICVFTLTDEWTHFVISPANLLYWARDNKTKILKKLRPRH